MSDPACSGKEAIQVLGSILLLVAAATLFAIVTVGTSSSIYNNLVEIPDYKYNTLYHDLESHDSEALNMVVKDALSDYEITWAEHYRIESVVERLRLSRLKNQIADEVR